MAATGGKTAMTEVFPGFGRKKMRQRQDACDLAATVAVLAAKTWPWRP